MSYGFRTLLLIAVFISLIIPPCMAQSFDIQAFSDTTRYGWHNYLERNDYRQELNNRQSLLQIYELEAQPLNANIIKSALIPGWGQFSTKANNKATIILGSELVLVGTSLYFMDRALRSYRLYKTATQVQEIETNYKDSQVPYQYSLILLGFASVVWTYNIFDVIQSTQTYNANLWQEVMERRRNNPVQITPNGVEVRF